MLGQEAEAHLVRVRVRIRDRVRARAMVRVRDRVRDRIRDRVRARVDQARKRRPTCAALLPYCLPMSAHAALASPARGGTQLTSFTANVVVRRGGSRVPPRAHLIAPCVAATTPG